MKVILLENLATLGDVGDVVNVANGYARNFLLPKKIAQIADLRNVAEFENLKRQAAAKMSIVKSASEDVKNSLSEVSINFTRKVGEQDKLFGSVTSMDIAQALKEKGYDLDRRQILLDAPIKQLGVVNIPVRLAGNVEAEIKVWVASDEEKVD